MYATLQINQNVKFKTFFFPNKAIKKLCNLCNRVTTEFSEKTNGVRTPKNGLNRQKKWLHIGYTVPENV